MYMRNTIFMMVFGIVLVLIGVTVGGAVTTGLWNYVVAPLCETHKIGFWQGCGVYALVSIGYSCLKVMWKSDRP